MQVMRAHLALIEVGSTHPVLRLTLSCRVVDMLRHSLSRAIARELTSEGLTRVLGLLELATLTA